jgi:hypothetical protein
VAHRPRVELKIGELREELAASDPSEMRRRALNVLSKIMAKQLDPRYRRTALDVLHYLDAQELAVEGVRWEAYHAAAAQIAELDAAAANSKKRVGSTSTRSLPTTLPPELNVIEEHSIQQGSPVVLESPEEAELRLAEIQQVVRDRQRMRFGQEPATQATQATDSQFDDLTQPAEEDRTAEEKQVRYMRKPGHFGRGGWTHKA